MAMSLFSSLFCLPLLKQDSELCHLSIEHDSVPQDVTDAQIMGTVSFLIAEMGQKEDFCLLSPA